MFRSAVIPALLLSLLSCSSGPWPGSDQQRFMNECEGEGGSRSYCRCFLDNVMEQFPNVSDAERMDFETAVELSKDCEQ